MRRILFAIAVMLTLQSTVRADYEPTRFLDLAGTSKAIVAGTITKLEKETFVLKVEDSIVGPLKTDQSITVCRFQDWVCAQRWSPYSVGQNVFLFLDQEANESHWYIRGAAGEGESPLVKDAVHANFKVPGKPIEYETESGRRSLPSVSYDDLRTAILDLRATYSFTRAQGEEARHVLFARIEHLSPPSTGKFRPRRSPPEFSTRSILHRYLAEQIEIEITRIREYRKQKANGGGAESLE